MAIYKPGVYLSIQKKSSTTNTRLSGWETPLKIPVESKIVSLSIRHSLFSPMEKLFSFLSQQSSSLASSVAAGLGIPSLGNMVNWFTQTSSSVADILGIKLHTEAYYAQAWKGTDPISFAVELNFFLGMNGEWDAQKEVYVPIRLLTTSLLPESIGPFLHSPMMNAVDVFAMYGKDLVEKLIKTILSGETTTVLQTSSTQPTGSQQSSASLSLQTLPTGRGYFTLQYEYNTANGASIPILTFEKVLIGACTSSFGSVVDEDGYPVTGSVNLNCISQKILIQGDNTFRK